MAQGTKHDKIGLRAGSARSVGNIVAMMHLEHPRLYLRLHTRMAGPVARLTREYAAVPREIDPNRD
jgi:hypothetical protein